MNAKNKKTYTLQDVTTREQLDLLYNSSALTSEGFAMGDENIQFLINWLEENGADPKDNLDIYVTKGKFMNESYGLTGDNAYPDDLNIVSIPLDELGNSMAIVIARFQLGLRWFDDVVDNSLRHEEEGD